METNDLRKAAEMALEALEDVVKWYASRDANENLMPCHNQSPEIKLSMESVEALRQALEEPEQEPVAWFIQYEYRHEFLWRKPNELEQKTALEIKPLYTAPAISDYHEGWEEGFKAAKREWVGLTDEERDEIDQNCRSQMEALFAIEAKLKDKNNG